MKTRQACVRLRSLGLPAQQTDELISLFQKWTERSGKEWTVSRFKDLKQELLSRRAGGDFRAPWIARNRKDGLPKGTLHYIFKRGLSNDRQFKKMVNVLMVYSTLTLPKMSKKQERKFFGSMMSKDQTGCESKFRWVPRLKTVKLASECSEATTLDVYLPSAKSFVEFCTSPMKSAPSLLGRSIRQDDSFGQLVFFLNSTCCQEILRECPNVFLDVLPWKYVSMYRDSAWMNRYHLYDAWTPRSLPECENSVGKIGLPQEAGCKLRGVAVVNAVLQAALQPLKSMILRDLELNFPTDCTHNQLAGAMKIQSWLQEGKTCYSVDLSDATNMFPFSIQEHVLRDRYCNGPHSPLIEEYVKCFRMVSKSPYYLVKDVGQHDEVVSSVSFTRGQPLGAGPSFATFALSHNVFLLGICKSVGVDPKETFRILGDDIVISDERVHAIYRSSLRNLGCPVSESKCLTSKEVAEFAGFVIMKDQLFHPYKWKCPTWDNFVSLCKEYGPSSRQLVWGAKRHVLDFLAPIPEELGGFGWNPKGLSLEERLNSVGVQSYIGIESEKTHTCYRTLTSLVEALDTAVLECGLMDASYLPFNPRIGRSDFRIYEDFPTRKVDECGWVNSDVIRSLREKNVTSSEKRPVNPDGTFIGKHLPEGFHSNWIDGYGLVTRNGDLPFDPTTTSSRQRAEVILNWMAQQDFDPAVIARARKRISQTSYREKPAKNWISLRQLPTQVLPRSVKESRDDVTNSPRQGWRRR